MKKKKNLALRFAQQATEGKDNIFFFLFFFFPLWEDKRLNKHNKLTVGLGNTLQLVLLLNGVGVGRALGGVDELISQALSNGLHVAEGSLARTSGQEPDSLVNTTEGSHIDGLTTDGTGGSDTGGIFTETGVDDGLNEDLDGVLITQEGEGEKGLGISFDLSALFVLFCLFVSKRLLLGRRKWM